MSNPDSYGVMNTATVTDHQGNQYVISSWIGGTDTGPTFCPQLPGNHLPPVRIGGGVSSNRLLMTLPWASKIAPRPDSPSKLLTATETASRAPAGPTDTLGRSFAFYNGEITTTDYGGCASGHTISAATMQSYIAPDGTTRQMKLCYANIPISTAFNVPGIAGIGPDPTGHCL